MPSDTTNLSTSTRPKTPNNGGKLSDLVLSRKRRQVDGFAHVFNVTKYNNTVLKISPSTSSVDIVHATVINVPHETLITTYNEKEETSPEPQFSSTGQYEDNLSTTSEGKGSTLLNVGVADNENVSISELPSGTSQDIFNNDINGEETKSTEIFTNAIKSETNRDDINNEEEVNISDSSLFTLDSDIYDEIENEQKYSISELNSFDSSEIQHDAPIMTLNRNDDIQFFDMGSKHLTFDQKSKALYNTDEEKQKDEPSEILNTNLSVLNLNEGKNMKKEVGLTTALPPQLANGTKEPSYSKAIPKIEQIEIPVTPNTSTTPLTNKIVVNITIATGYENTMLNSLPPIYVLSLLIPTNGADKPNVILNNNESNHTKPKTNDDKKSKEVPTRPPVIDNGINDSTNDNSGGTCECSCPCLDSHNESSELNFDEDFDLFNYLNLSLENSNKTTTSTERALNFTSSTMVKEIMEVSSTTIDDMTNDVTESVSTVRHCPIIKPPPILILEGRTLK